MTVVPAGRPRTGFLTGSWPLGLPPSGRFFTDFARHVEARGFDLLFAGDHLFMHSPNPDVVSLLAAYGAATERLLVGTAVLLPALREPVVTAKQLATVDYLTGGRLIVAAGVGGEIEQEWRAMQVPRSERGARTDEALALMRAFWSGEPLDFSGRFREVHGVTGSPSPATPGGPPVWIGGRSDAALRRAARHDGWFAYACSPERVRQSIARIQELRDGDMSGYRISNALFVCVKSRREEARELARQVLARRYDQDFDRFLDRFCAVGTPDEVLARVREYREAGVEDLLLLPQAPWEEFGDQVDALAELLVVCPGD